MLLSVGSCCLFFSQYPPRNAFKDNGRKMDYNYNNDDNCECLILD